ncbi:MAG: carboxypeptidase regulatory-like domain-containing protein, partial [Patescibacteria group bacterium]|nr:carboxypeptidase regulatory-like domain-containing protein [Patescibacteria group bacterium]
MGKTAFVANMRILRNVFIVSGLVTVLLVIAAIGVHTALAADALSVSPKVTKDGLIGETSANWTFTITTATQLNPGDVVQFIFPNITSGAVPFDVSSATLVATSSADTTFNLYPTTSTSTAGLAAAQGPLGPTVYGFATTTIPANTSFTVTIGGIANAIGQLSSVQNLTFTAQAGTPSDPTHPEGPLSVTKYNSGGSLSSAISLTRSGGALVSDANSAITPSSTNVSATNVSYTFSITSHSTIVAGSKILINFPATYDISGATVATQIIDPIGGASVAAGAIATSTANNSNRAILTVSGVVLSGDVMTVTVGGITNPSIAGVYRPFSLFTTNGNGGLIDGSYFGFEPSDYSNGAPSPNDTVYIGGKNTLNIQVLKSNGAGGTTALSAGDIAQMKVAAGCPDRQYFMGQKWLDSSGVASYHDILDCNYMVGVDPFSATSTSFYSSYLPPGMKQFNLVSSSGVGQTATTTLVFGIPNSTTTVEVDLPNAVANAQAFVQAYSADNQSFSPIYTTPTGTTQGFDGSGHGYAHINIDRGKTWNFNVMGGQYGSSGNITDGSGNKYWAPQLPSINLTSASSSANLGVYTYTLANNTLNVTLQDTSNGAINNACVGVSRSGGGIFMGPQDMICTPNNNGAYQFKVPTGTVTIDVSLPGHGEPSEYPVAISGATTNKTITLAAPSTYVSVVVETSSGTKIKGAPVFANGGDGFGNAMTDNTGAAKIYVPPGLYSVQGFAPGFGSLTSQTATVANGSDPLVTFTVNTGTLKTISGTVTQGGLPVAGINIGAHGTGSTTGGNGTQTDTNGNYTLYLPAGTYEVGGWSPSTGGLAEQAVDVTSSDATGIDWALGAQGTLHLTIHNASTLGSLSAGAFDSTTGMGNSTNSWTTTGTDKVADITLPAGTHYSVQASTPGLGQFGSQSSVTITAGGTTNVSFDAASGTTLVSLSGSVTAGGSPVSGVNVWASRTDGPGFFSTQTDTNGAYSLTVPDGKTYHVGVRSLAYIASQGDVDVAVNGGAVQNFTLTAAGATITGKVLDANGNPVANGWVSAVQTGVASSTTVGAPTDAAGNYTLNVTNSSTWNLTAQGPCFLRSSAIAASAGDSGKNITLTAQSGCTKPVPQIYAITDTTGGQISTGNMTINI